MLTIDYQQRVAVLEDKVTKLERELEELKLSFKRYVDNNSAALQAARRSIPIGGGRQR